MLHAKNKVRRLLRLCRRLNNQLLVILQLLKPVLNIGGCIFKDALGDSGLAAKERRAHFGNQFLFAIGV